MRGHLKEAEPSCCSGSRFRFGGLGGRGEKSGVRSPWSQDVSITEGVWPTTWGSLRSLTGDGKGCWLTYSSSEVGRRAKLSEKEVYLRVSRKHK